MQTNFSSEQLIDPQVAISEQIIRKCVHCGFCTATCPTYVLLGDELDSPRGRIYLIKDMLENGRAPDAKLVTHIDRCLSCLSCMTTCPSGVNYMRLVDHARSYIEDNYTRPLHERFWRSLLAAVLPYPGRFSLALALAPLGKLFAPIFQLSKLTRPLAAMVALAPDRIPVRMPVHDSKPGGASLGRIIMLQGCAEPVLKPQYQAAAARLLARLGYGVVFAREEKCCGALVQHMGREAAAKAAARNNVDAWMAEMEKGDVVAIVTTASGCGTVLKDYGHILSDDPGYAQKAEACAALAKDISEVLVGCDLEPHLCPDAAKLTVAYHPACSLLHGQRIGDLPKSLLEKAGFTVCLPADAHLCCGSAGTYNILQPEISGQLARRKAASLAVLGADVVATGNIGCAVQIGKAANLPVVHTIEVLDWATGGERPVGLPELERN